MCHYSINSGQAHSKVDYNRVVVPSSRPLPDYCRVANGEFLTRGGPDPHLIQPAGTAATRGGCLCARCHSRQRVAPLFERWESVRRCVYIDVYIVVPYCGGVGAGAAAHVRLCRNVM